MNRLFLNFWQGIVIVKVTGKRLDRFLSYLYHLKINIVDLKQISRDELIVKIYNCDLEKVQAIKTSCELEIAGYSGKLGLINSIKKNRFILLSLLLGYILLIILSNLIFDVEVIHSNASIRKLLISELAEYNISKFHFKKSFAQIGEIKSNILNKYKDRLEWIEIENVGTKYIVKVEERKIKPSETPYEFQDIVSSKNAIIVKIEATEGEIVKQKNAYVKKGDILISGKIMKGEEITKIVKANGRIYGEVWYNIKVEIPIVFQNKKKTGKQKDIYKIVFLSHTFTLFNFHPFKNSISTTQNILSHPLIPFKIIKEKQSEVNIEDQIYTDDVALIKAERVAVKKMEDYLDDDEYIIGNRKLKYYIDEGKLHLEMFFKVCENIGVARKITE